MKKKSKISSPIRYETSLEERELDTFCQLEKALKEEENQNNLHAKKPNVTFDLPDSFMEDKLNDIENNPNISQVQKHDFHEAFMELQRRLNDVKRREADLLRDENWIKTEKAQIEKERKIIMENKMITDNNLQNAEVINLRNKLAELQNKYENEKRQWRIERQQLIEQIPKLPELQPPAKPRVTFAAVPRIASEDNFKKINDEEEEAEQEEDEAFNFEQHEEEEAVLDDDSPIVQKIKETQVLNQIMKRDYIVNQENQQKSDSKKPRSPSSKYRKKQIIHDKYQLDFDYNPGPIYKEDVKKDGRKVVVFKDGSKGTVFRNGTKKVRRGQNLYIFYANKDIAIEFPDKAVGYKYKETNAVELSLPDGSVIYVFPNGQKEKHYANGDKAIQFPNGTYKIIYPNGDYETHFPDGKIEALTNGKIVVTYD